MRKAILERFILVLLAALCIHSVIFYCKQQHDTGYVQQGYEIHHQGD
jgi:hypothetical protein